MPEETGASQARENGGDPMKPPQPREAHGTCGAKTRSGEPCKNVAGKGTSHLGIGRCKFHGGSTPMKHGMYSTVVRETLGELIERERRKKGIRWSELGKLIADFWAVLESHVDDEATLDQIANDWKRIYDVWEFAGPEGFDCW